ncbi:MAG: hypothetical protein FJY99_00250 [Candidatus Sericytochromatia bacterium]|nr:hypothetical protein [Candidatus Tanganyikabacteria bacterium]
MRRAWAVVPLLAACTSSDGLKLVSPSATAAAPVTWEQLVVKAEAAGGPYWLVALNDAGATVDVKPDDEGVTPTFRVDQLVTASGSALITDAATSVGTESVFVNPYRPGSIYAYRYATTYDHKGQSPAVSVLELGAETSTTLPGEVEATTIFTALSSRSVTLALKPCTNTAEASCSITGVVWFTVPEVTEARSLRLYLNMLNAAGKAQSGEPSTPLPIQAPVTTPTAAPVTPPAT